jgi:anti-sigma factor RsiW
MRCEWSSKLDGYVDGELGDGELKEMQSHFVGCAACAAGALSRLQMKRMTQAAAGSRYRPAAEFRLRVEDSVSGRKGSGWRRWAPILAVPAMLVLVVGAAGVWMQSVRGEQAAGEMADLHVSTLASANPVDVVSTDRHTVKPWFQGKLPFSFDLPELQNSEFKLLGGRVSYFHQSAGAQLLFTVRKHEVSVFVFQNRGEAALLRSGAAVRARLTFNSETWAVGGLRYFVVGDCSATDIHGLSQLLQRAAGA